MNDYNFDSGEYGTGRTQPPKSHGGLIALLLILVIFLTGIVTVLGILNIRLSRQLSATQEEAELAISFIRDQEQNIPQSSDTVPAPTALSENNFDLPMSQSPQAQDNVLQEDGLRLQDIYRQNIDSVVGIQADFADGSSTGTGVILSADGFIVTMAHLVENAQSITVVLSDQTRQTARLVGADALSDLAVLHIQTENLLPAQFCSSDTLQVGDSVAAIGRSQDFQGILTDGIISAIGMDAQVEGRSIGLIRTNASLPGVNAGGPLINCYGQVIGINTGIQSNIETEGFAIPSAAVKEIVDELMSQGYISGRPTLGLTGESLTPYFRSYYRLPAGLYVTELFPGGPAQDAGIELGDIIIDIAGEPIYDLETMYQVLFRYQVGDVVPVTIYRYGMQSTNDITLGEDPR